MSTQPVSETLSARDGQYVDDFLAEQRNYNSQSTVSGKKTDLRKFAAWLSGREGVDSLTDVTPRDFKHFIRDVINEGFAANTIYRRYNSVKTFYDWLENERIMPEGFAVADRISDGQHKAMRGNTKKEDSIPDFYLTQDEVEKLLENAPHPRLRSQLIIKLMFHCGLRCGEVATIKLDNINWDERKITVRNLKSGGNQRAFRRVWYQRNLGMLLHAWVEGGDRDSQYHSPSPYLIPTQQAQKISKDQINQIVKLAAERAGLQETMYTDSAGNERKKITAHTLRHSYAVHCVKSGMDIKTLRDLMGHSDIGITQKYLKFKDEALRKSALQHGPGSDAD